VAFSIIKTDVTPVKFKSLPLIASTVPDPIDPKDNSLLILNSSSVSKFLPSSGENSFITDIQPATGVCIFTKELIAKLI